MNFIIILFNFKKCAAGPTYTKSGADPEIFYEGVEKLFLYLRLSCQIN